MPKLAKLRDLAAQAGRWLGLSSRPPAHTAAIAGDRFDDMTWQEIHAQAAALRDLIDQLAERHDYAADLVRDVFLAAYKFAPELRERADMDPSRLVNRQIVASLLEAPDFADLRRETIGDQYASAMAVLAMAERLREMTDQAREAQEAADAAAAARQEEAAAAAAVEQAMGQAAAQAGPDGTVPDEAAAAAGQATARAEGAAQAAADADGAASQALDAAAPELRTAAREAADAAGAAARDEAELMAGWGVTPGELRRMPFEPRRRLAERLRGTRLTRFTSLIGRFRALAAAERARKVERAPGELVGIEVSDDLGRLIPSELAALAVPAMRAAFAARLAAGQLFTYATRGDDRVGRGAIIALIDGSGSMATKSAGGITREAWAKACALALLDQARAGRRDFVGIVFGTVDEEAGTRELAVFRFPAGQPPAVSDVVDFTEVFFRGGTNFEVPLKTAAELLETEFNRAGRQRGDIAFITDGVCRVSEEWMLTWRHLKARLAFRVFGISIGCQPTPVMQALCDNLRRIDDLADPAQVGDIFRVT